MIGLTFQGQLGNQLFQYAAARVQAERLGCGLVLGANAGRRAIIANALQKRLPHKICAVFPALRVHPLSYALAISRATELTYVSVRDLLFAHRFEPRLSDSEEDVANEAYDSQIWEIPKGCWLTGYFQSPKYFFGWEPRVRQWYRPSDKILESVSNNLATLPQNHFEMVAVHVRLGDYLSETGYHADPRTGWALTREYYARALARLPDSLPIALFSDDPEAATDILPRKATWTSRGNDAGVDLFLMGSFPFMVIANSSFSWWAGWLNPYREKVIIAPEYHIGWRRRVWFPADIKVDSWIYV
jgi:Glycosyl transferase family 11